MSYTAELPARTLLKPSEASTRFNVPLPTIYFWYRVGNIHGINVNGRCLRIYSASLEAFLGRGFSPRGKAAMIRRSHVATP
jgi:predicted site-specific integrase-resolvase